MRRNTTHIASENKGCLRSKSRVLLLATCTLIFSVVTISTLRFDRVVYESSLMWGNARRMPNERKEPLHRRAQPRCKATPEQSTTTV